MKNRFDGEKTLYFVCAVLVSGLVLGSCSKLQNNVLVPVQSQSDIHPIGWTDITSQSFHGNYVKSQKFQTTICTSCHGSDLSGGTAQVSCYKCHQGSDGSLACNTCHGSVLNPAPPKDLAGDSLTSAPGVGAHQIHLRGSSSVSSLCLLHVPYRPADSRSGAAPVRRWGNSHHVGPRSDPNELAGHSIL